MTIHGPGNPGIATADIRSLAARIDDNHNASIEYLKVLAEGQKAVLEQLVHVNGQLVGINGQLVGVNDRLNRMLAVQAEIRDELKTANQPKDLKL